MDTEVVVIEESGIDAQADQALRRAGELLRSGALVAFPTETVYGLGGDALNPEASRKIYEAKGRPSDNPLIVHISRFEDIYRIAREVPDAARKLAEAYWPGPLTMILQKADCVPKETTGGLDTVAVRLPAHETARRMIAYAGGYVAAPSANRSGRPSPTTAKYVIEDLQGRVDMIIDGGHVGIGLESTIIDLTVSPPQILRPGYITQEMLVSLLGEVEVDRALLGDDSGQAPRAPGMKYRHYAPKGELTIVSGGEEAVVSYINERIAQDTADGKRTGVIAAKETAGYYHASVVRSVGSRGDEESIAKHLYEVLRAFDEEAVDNIYSESFAQQGFGHAIMNRLLKAAGHRVVCADDPEKSNEKDGRAAWRGQKGEQYDSNRK